MGARSPRAAALSITAGEEQNRRAQAGAVRPSPGLPALLTQLSLAHPPPGPNPIKQDRMLGCIQNDHLFSSPA